MPLAWFVDFIVSRCNVTGWLITQLSGSITCQVANTCCLSLSLWALCSMKIHSTHPLSSSQHVFWCFSKVWKGWLTRLEVYLFLYVKTWSPVSFLYRNSSVKNDLLRGNIFGVFFGQSCRIGWEDLECTMCSIRESIPFINIYIYAFSRCLHPKCLSRAFNVLPFLSVCVFP